MGLQPKKEDIIRKAYGFALEVGGIEHAREHLDQVMGNTFSTYFPSMDAFQDFVPMFRSARFDVVKNAGWLPTADRQKLGIDPEQEQPIQEYFDDVFRLAVANGENTGGGDE